MEKKTKRSQIKYSALDPSVNLKTRYELISDYDYLDELSEKEKAWLNKFTKEYVNADLNTKKKSRNLHKTERLKKDCYDRNNARNRCILTRCRASGNLVHSIHEVSKHKTKDSESTSGKHKEQRPLSLTGGQTPDSYENFLIELIDLKKK